MKVLRVTKLGVSIATPRWSDQDRCLAFFHNGQVGEYCLCVKHWYFSNLKQDDWTKAEYNLDLSGVAEYNDLGDRIYALKSGSASSSCLCLLDIEMASLFSWNEKTAILARGRWPSVMAERPRRSSARCAPDIECSVLLCDDGARFAWINHGPTFGRPADYKAVWDGRDFHISRRQLAIDPAIIQRLEQPCRRRCRALAT